MVKSVEELWNFAAPHLQGVVKLVAEDSPETAFARELRDRPPASELTGHEAFSSKCGC